LYPLTSKGCGEVRKGLEGCGATFGGHAVTAQRAGTGARERGVPESPVFAAKPQKCAQILKNLRRVKLLINVLLRLTRTLVGFILVLSKKTVLYNVLKHPH
jgi:hypothetical protein